MSFEFGINDTNSLSDIGIYKNEETTFLIIDKLTLRSMKNITCLKNYTIIN